MIVSTITSIIAVIAVGYALLQRRRHKREIAYAERRGENKSFNWVFDQVYGSPDRKAPCMRNPVYGTPHRPHQIMGRQQAQYDKIG